MAGTDLAGLHHEPRPPEPVGLEPGRDGPGPTFRLPTLIHTRSGNAKYLNEISHRTRSGSTPRTLGAWASTPDLLRVTTEIGIS